MAEPEDDLEQQIRALDAGMAFIEQSDLRIILVSGGDARGWLNDLLTADIEGIARGASRRSLLLSPTGRIRADAHVLGLADGLALVQGPGQPDAIERLLDPYILSSDVRLDRVQRAVLCAPGRGSDPPTARRGIEVIRPSMLDGGFDLVVSGGRGEREAVKSLLDSHMQVGEAAVRAWEIRRGVPRFPDDVGPDSLPAEANLGEPVIDFTKGCFLGQESVAKVRNLGHPPHAVMAARTEGHLIPGEVVLAGDAEAGIVTAASPMPTGGAAALIRIRWTARAGPLVTRSGVPLIVRQGGPRDGR